MFRVLGFALAGVIALAAQTSAMAEDRIRLAVQRTGTLAWELDVIRTHGLDRKFDLAIETVELASTEAGKIALKGGSADLMLSDWLWVARERSLGDDLVFYPSSSTLGAVMVPAESPIREIVDLRGKRLAVAGGPLDKSWLLLQALARRAGLDLKKQATVVYGAPPLLSEKASSTLPSPASPVPPCRCSDRCTATRSKLSARSPPGATWSLRRGPAPERPSAFCYRSWMP